MSRDEGSSDDRRPFARDDADASAARGSTPSHDQRRDAPPPPTPKPRHAQMVFITPMGVPIGPSVEEELNIPDDLDDTLPTGDFPGQLLLDLGLR